MNSLPMDQYKIFFLFLLLAFASYVIANDDQKKLQNYIVTLKPTDGVDISNPKTAETWHKSILSSVTNDDPELRHIYSYNKVSNGFAARLTEEDVEAMKDYPGCTRIIPADQPLQLMTTHTPHFLGLQGKNGFWRRTKNMGEGIIIGVLDSGISPGHPSFADKDMPSPPAKWKGHCDFNSTVCNNKLIGAKTMLKAGSDEKHHKPPIDTTGHGTHTASTAAGTFVNNITVLGNAMGKASGIAPRAHLAVYKVCDELGCQTPDVLKGFEEAVNDGCDVISISIAGPSVPLYSDVISVASFYAILNGVFVSAGAGNSGPNASTVANSAPWLLTVGASTMDRQIRSTVELGNGLKINGESLYQPMNWTSKMLPLVYVAGDGTNANASQCLNGTLDKKLVHGKIVVCDYGLITPNLKGAIVREAGGAGMIIANTEKEWYFTQADAHLLPASHVSSADGIKIKDYIRSTKQPIAALLFKGLVHHNKFSPSITVMSSRGPSLNTPLTLKPDIVGPGVSVLAAVPPYATPPRILGQEKYKSFYFMSGTSMATPHLGGIAALVKKSHPDWSPSAIKSAIMTTAHVTDTDGNPIVDHTQSPANVFDMGAGHVDPNKALDPGLVYDIDYKDYISYLCGLGLEDADVNNIITPAPPVECAKVKVIPEEQLNYPLIAVPIEGNTSTMAIYRTVTNVGKAAKVTYKAAITVSRGMSIEVVPSTLKFTSLNEKKTFKINFKREDGDRGAGLGAVPTNPFSFGELKWITDSYSVRSPIVLFY
ncbi:hypothetical protein LUZ63_015787 [Rhynchospora breviuscula]|uniref:Subtilisin-like protease n=1 Tax=Rhynchospora breviuscula TaxID=2022672 RepID=A0A9Q0HMJ8_9POAL|nr:hypothetical protein LUZ63_015787 [Rhynchospora breviuscula]